MSDSVPSIRSTTKTLPCKVCANPSHPFGSVDFNRNCEGDRANLPITNLDVPYHRCRSCGLVFTVAFDDWSPGDFGRHIYNDDYIKVDPKFTGQRADDQAAWIAKKYPGATSAKILDYGGGTGLCAARLRTLGYSHVTTFDPFVPEFAARPRELFDMIISFEVAEHSPTPIETFTDLASFGAVESIILFTTLLQPPDIERTGLTWWYIAPRNGHVTLYSRRSLELIAERLGMQFRTNGNVHAMFRSAPPFSVRRS